MLRTSVSVTALYSLGLQWCIHLRHHQLAPQKERATLSQGWHEYAKASRVMFNWVSWRTRHSRDLIKKEVMFHRTSCLVQTPGKRTPRAQGVLEYLTQNLFIVWFTRSLRKLWFYMNKNPSLSFYFFFHFVSCILLCWHSALSIFKHERRCWSKTGCFNIFLGWKTYLNRSRDEVKISSYHI